MGLRREREADAATDAVPDRGAPGDREDHGRAPRRGGGAGLRLTKDEWVKALYADDNPRSAQDVIEGRLVTVGLRALELGVSVVIDFGLWSRDERSALRQAAADRGADVELLYCELDAAEQRRRLDRRQSDAPQTSWPMSASQLAGWAAEIDVPTPGELDGSEPIDDPPAGFATWEEWRSHRWPLTVP